jgi:hypothetical protein
VVADERMSDVPTESTEPVDAVDAAAGPESPAPDGKR